VEASPRLALPGGRLSRRSAFLGARACGSLPLAAAPLLFGTLLLASAEAPGPAHVDWTRGIEKQTEAAREATREVEPGLPAAARALALLADPSGYVRDAVFLAIQEKWSEEALVALAPGLLSDEPLVAAAVAELFGRRRPAAGLESLTRALSRHPDTGARALMAWAAGEYGDAAAIAALREQWRRDRDWEVRAEILLLLGRLERTAAREAIDEALAEKKALPLRIAGLRALEQYDGPGAAAAALAQLTEPPKDRQQVWGPRIELAALGTLARADRLAVPRETLVAAIDRILATLDESSGRARRSRFETLAAITGESMPFEALNWRAWWGTVREKWQPGAVASAAGGADGGEPAHGGTAVVRFHGIPVDSMRVTFLQDLSGGMSRNLAGEEAGAGPSRLDHAKEELVRVLGALDDRTWVNVITFASSYWAPNPEPQLLGAARKKLAAFCREQQIPTASGHARGNVFDPLAFAATSPYVDTIYLVSEGAPTEGKYHDYDRFLWHFERLNRWSLARVHVLLVAETGGRNRAFLGALAGSTGGEVRAVTATEKE